MILRKTSANGAQMLRAAVGRPLVFGSPTARRDIPTRVRHRLAMPAVNDLKASGVYDNSVIILTAELTP